MVASIPKSNKFISRIAGLTLLFTRIIGINMLLINVLTSLKLFLTAKQVPNCMTLDFIVNN